MNNTHIMNANPTHNLKWSRSELEKINLPKKGKDSQHTESFFWAYIDNSLFYLIFKKI